MKNRRWRVSKNQLLLLAVVAGIKEKDLQALVKKLTNGRDLGFLEEPRVNGPETEARNFSCRAIEVRTCAASVFRASRSEAETYILAIVR